MTGPLSFPIALRHSRLATVLLVSLSLSGCSSILTAGGKTLAAQEPVETAEKPAPTTAAKVAGGPRKPGYVDPMVAAVTDEGQAEPGEARSAALTASSQTTGQSSGRRPCPACP